jgi:DNA-binding HxlR family transcriptional regulator
MFEKRNYGDFILSEEKIASNILADRLKLLCSYDILVKTSDSRNKLKFIYRATEKGKALMPVMRAMTDWGSAYFPEKL